MTMIDYRYDLIKADIDYHIKEHPQTDLIKKGLKWERCEPCPIADCWFFEFKKEIINPPPYLEKLNTKFFKD